MMGASFIAAVIGVSPTIQRHSLRLLQFSTLLITLSGITLALSWPAAKIAIFGDLCNVCAVFRISRVLFGVGNGFGWCFGVAYLYGVTRREVHKDQLHLMGILAIAMVAGEAIGFSTAFLGYIASDWTWLFTTALGTTTAAFTMIPNKYLEHYGHLDQGNDLDDGSGVRLSRFLCEYAAELRSLLSNWRFGVRLLLASVQWSSVDLIRSAYKFAFEDFLQKVGENEASAYWYSLAADIASIVFCFVSVAFNHFGPRYSTRVQRWLQEEDAFNLKKLSLFGTAACVSLSFAAYYDARTGPTLHMHIGLPFVFYVAFRALSMETLLEFVPFLFTKRTFLPGWALTVFLRHLSKYLLKMYLPVAVEHFSLWTIFLCGILSTFLMVASTWLVIRRLGGDGRMFIAKHEAHVGNDVTNGLHNEIQELSQQTLP
ncbi:hypothetical protein AAVH_18770 [Aphelenchoides avenae]|nr:hypothetical protein AAVH_18770 [Aphelenchus avenae]